MIPRIVRITPVFSTISAIFEGQNRYLAENGFKICVISSPDDTSKDVSKVEGFEHYPIDISREITPVKDAVAIGRLVKILNVVRPDLVHTHTSKAGLLGMVASAAANIRHRIHSVAGWSADSRGGWLKTPMMLSEKVTFKLASRILVNSHSLRDYLIESGYLLPQKSLVLGSGSSNGVDMDRFHAGPSIRATSEQLRNSLNIPADGIVLGFVGRVMLEKGVKELLEAFAYMNRNNKKIHLMIIGSVEEGSRKAMPDEILSVIRTHPDIHMTGWVEDVSRYLSCVDILVHPSHHEGMPNAILQGSAMEIPCVASKVCGNIDAVVHGVTGYLYEKDDLEAMLGWLNRLAGDKQLRISLGKEGRKFVSIEFDKSTVCRMLADFYRETLSATS